MGLVLVVWAVLAYQSMALAGPAMERARARAIWQGSLSSHETIRNNHAAHNGSVMTLLRAISQGDASHKPGFSIRQDDPRHRLGLSISSADHSHRPGFSIGLADDRHKPA